MARLLSTRPVNGQNEFELKPGPNRVGRAPDSDVFLTDPTVSGVHCEILVNDLQVRIRDLGSSNGTFVDNQPVAEAELKDGQQIRLGSFELRLAVPPVEISIPHISTPKIATPVELPGGIPACLEHPDVPATYRCVQCGRPTCDRCVHQLHLEGGPPRYFCPDCSGVCERLAPSPKRSRFSPRHILDTIRLAFDRISRPHSKAAPRTRRIHRNQRRSH